jgi:hypothetical protein
VYRPQCSSCRFWRSPRAAAAGGTVNTIGSLAPPSPQDNPNATFLDVTAQTSFNAIGGLQSLQTDALTGTTLYSGDTSTPNTASGTISYDPRDGIFTVALGDTAANVSQNIRYQDPAHRTDFLDLEIPDLDAFNYLEAGSDDGSKHVTSTFFYQRPGTTTRYVSLAGFVHIERDDATQVITDNERGALVFGSPTAMLQVPTSGSGHFAGEFLATMIDGGGAKPVFAWLFGNSAVDVDFAKSTVGLKLDGSVNSTFSAGTPAIAAGASFSATGAAKINPSAGSFSGAFSSAFFQNGSTKIPVDFTSVNPATNVAGASSIDGAFYGSSAQEVGGSFRIVGGVPNQRIDILGGFTGAKK